MPAVTRDDCKERHLVYSDLSLSLKDTHKSGKTLINVEKENKIYDVCAIVIDERATWETRRKTKKNVMNKR